MHQVMGSLPNGEFGMNDAYEDMKSTPSKDVFDDAEIEKLETRTKNILPLLWTAASAQKFKNPKREKIFSHVPRLAERDIKRWLASSGRIYNSFRKFEKLINLHLKAITSLHLHSTLGVLNKAADERNFAVVRNLYSAFVNLIPSLATISEVINSQNKHLASGTVRLSRNKEVRPFFIKLGSDPSMKARPNLLLKSNLKSLNPIDQLVIETHWVSHLLKLLSEVTRINRACHFHNLQVSNESMDVSESLQTLDDMAQFELRTPQGKEGEKMGMGKYVKDSSILRESMDRVMNSMQRSNGSCEPSAHSDMLKQGDMLISMLVIPHRALSQNVKRQLRESIYILNYVKDEA